MKMRIGLLALVLVLGAATVHAQSYSVPAWTMAGGGGSSSGTGTAGTFAVTGTLAQPEAHAASTGGLYRISGGFWSQYSALQAEGAPALDIRRNGANVELVWGANVQGWIVQTNADLSAPGWADVTQPPTVTGLEQFVSVPLSAGGMFFRLRER